MNAEALSGKVLGTCTLQKLIGRGGMAGVFLAQQSRPRRQVAVKVLLPMTRLQPGQHAAFLKRFQRETDAAASLAHPNIMPVHEYGEEDGLAYLVMPYISGGTLRDELEREGKLPLTQVINYLEQIAEALDFAHERGVIHRDIKPANIMLTPDKRLLLTDFGLAKITIADSDVSQTPLSGFGMPIGTPDYMSPEQVVGRDIDARADIYSLGVLTYQMITGSIPFKAEMPMKVALQHLHNEPPPLRPLRPDLPPEAEQVILRTLAKQAAERYMSAGEFFSALRQALEDAGVTLEPQLIEGSPRTNGDWGTNSRRRSLFDPFWRNALETLANGEQTNRRPEGVQRPDRSGVREEVEPIAMPGTQAAASPGHPTKFGIVSKTSVEPPSLSDLATATDQVAWESEIGSPLKATAMKSTPLPATQDQDQNMENTPFYPKPAKDDMSSPVPPGAENGSLAQNNPFSRMRLGNKTNLLGNTQNNGGQPGLQAGQSLPQPRPPFAPQPQGSATGNLGAGQQSPGGNSSFWSQGGMGELNGSAPMQQGGNGIGPRSQSGQLPNPGGNPALPGAGVPGPFKTSFNTSVGQPGASGMFNSFNGQPGANASFSNFGGQPGTPGSQPPQQRRVTGSLTYGGRPTGALPNLGATGALQMIPGNENTGQTGMLKLTQPVKVIKVPVAGQPGQYVTGLLPVLPGPEGEAQEDPQKSKKKKIQAIALVAAALVIIVGSLGFLLTHQSSGNPAVVKQTGTPNPKATATAVAQATGGAKATANAQANIILSDPMSSNAYNWHTDKQGFFFKNGAYHIKVNDTKAVASILPNPTPPAAFTYSLTVQQVDGMDNDDFNRFGLIIRYNSGNDTTFYNFVLQNNTLNGKYLFQKFDDNADTQYTELWSGDAGGECHLGKGQTNTFKIVANKDHFTFYVNGKQVGTAQDGSYANGQVGMLVNEKGTEVAFKNLLLTHQ